MVRRLSSVVTKGSAVPLPSLASLPSEEQYLNCIRCGLCLAVCPTYAVSLNEIDSPRGRVALARKGAEGELDLTPYLFEQMYECYACKACHDICPVGIRPGDLAFDMRAAQEQLRPAAWKKAVFGGIVANPARLEAVTAPLRWYESLGIRRLVRALGLHKLLPARLRDVEALAPRLPPRPLRRTLAEVTPAHGESKRQVGFFLGCLQSLIYAEQSAASVRVLARNGCTVVAPKQVVCCGMPALGFGQREQVLQQARRNIAVFEQAGVEAVITDCATCGSTLQEYGQLLAGDPDWAERAAAFSVRVRDVNEFLMSIPLEKPPGRIEARLTYHDPCHLRRVQGVWKEPRQILQLIDGIEFVELPEADWCCGLAGVHLITHYDTSVEVLKRKTDNLALTRADIVASGCPVCEMQLNVGVQRAGLEMEVVHPVTLLDRAYADDVSLREGRSPTQRSPKRRGSFRSPSSAGKSSASAHGRSQ
jgi:glycolate oxidase iron-sulfur subunit